MITLEPFGDGHAGLNTLHFPEGDSTIVGRNASTMVALEMNDKFAGFLSREHCQIFLRDGFFFVLPICLNESAVCVNDTPCKSATERPVSVGDVITLLGHQKHFNYRVLSTAAATECDTAPTLDAGFIPTSTTLVSSNESNESNEYTSFNKEEANFLQEQDSSIQDLKDALNAPVMQYSDHLMGMMDAIIATKADGSESSDFLYKQMHMNTVPYPGLQVCRCIIIVSCVVSCVRCVMSNDMIW
jgi:hypothetical protein